MFDLQLLVIIEGMVVQPYSATQVADGGELQVQDLPEQRKPYFAIKS